jgi:hypothetical protein
MRLKRVYERTIPFDQWQLTGFPPANGLCSIICKSLSTSFTGTSDLFTAWKIYGATHRGSNGKRPRRTNCAEAGTWVARLGQQMAGAALDKVPTFFIFLATAMPLGWEPRAQVLEPA